MRLIGCILLILCLSRVGLAAGIQALPGKLLIRDVPVGKLYEVSVPLTIINQGQDEQSYVLSTVKPSAIGAVMETGYVEIPDERWLYFATETITVKPGDFGQARMYMRVPNEEGCYNQHWVVVLRVAAISSSSLSLALYPRYQIETEAKPGIRGTEKMGIAPSVVTPGKRKGFVTVFNNDKQAHGYKITTVGDNYARMQLDKHLVRIKPGGKARIGIKVMNNNPWEGVLLIEADDGEKGFVRVEAASSPYDF